MNTADKIPFILCADDFGISPAVSAGILEAVLADRLSAVSCMVVHHADDAQVRELAACRNRVDIGLHLTLTGDAGRYPSFGTLAMQSVFGRCDLSWVRQEIRDQLDMFGDLFGTRPTFIDGHQHVHQLPGIRRVLLEEIDAVSADWRPVVRDCSEPVRQILTRGVAPMRAIAIGMFGRSMRRGLTAHGLPSNLGFSGVHDFSGRVPYDRLFDRFTDQISPGALVICHPGYVDDALRALDPLLEPRTAELSYLLSDAFKELLDRKNLRIVRFSDIAA